jgi:two-component system chemotaxis family response regulator WspR
MTTTHSNRVQTPVVLLVDDQQMVAEGIRRMLAEHNDIHFHYCDNSLQALAKATAIKPTIILQDLIMPDLDGYALLRLYKSNSITKNIPVIVLSTKEDPRDKSLAFEHGANDYLVKLPDRIELVARIKAHTKNYLMQCERDQAIYDLGRLQRQLEINNEELQKLSCQDGLTGIANRRRFNEFFYKECLRSAREKTPLSLLLIDIDFFKLYNDNYGHVRGDECISTVAVALQNAVQRPADLVARYGGEEFAVVLPNTEVDGALKMAQSLHKTISTLKIPHPHSAVADSLTVSIGIACKVINETNSPEQLIELADHALYEAKHSGRNCSRVSQSGYSAKVVSHIF